MAAFFQEAEFQHSCGVSHAKQSAKVPLKNDSELGRKTKQAYTLHIKFSHKSCDERVCSIQRLVAPRRFPNTPPLTVWPNEE